MPSKKRSVNKNYYTLIATKAALAVGKQPLFSDWGSRGREFKSRHSDQKVPNFGYFGRNSVLFMRFSDLEKYSGGIKNTVF